MNMIQRLEALIKRRDVVVAKAIDLQQKYQARLQIFNGLCVTKDRAGAEIQRELIIALLGDILDNTAHLYEISAELSAFNPKV